MGLGVESLEFRVHVIYIYTQEIYIYIYISGIYRFRASDYNFAPCTCAAAPSPVAASTSAESPGSLGSPWKALDLSLSLLALTHSPAKKYVCMYVCVYVRMYVCTHAHTHTRIQVGASSYTYTRVYSKHIYIYTYIYMYTYIHVHTDTHFLYSPNSMVQIVQVHMLGLERSDYDKELENMSRGTMRPVARYIVCARVLLFIRPLTPH